MKVKFTETGWKEYKYWESQDKRTIKQINRLIEDIERNRFDGIGQPEALRGDLSGWWSRHIDEKNRLVYRIVDDDTAEISQCKDHYRDK